MVERNRKPPETKPKTEVIEDFSSGLNTTISPSLLNSNEAQVADDVSFEQKGTIVPRKGRRSRYTNPFSETPTSGLGMLYKQDGTSRLVVTSDTSIYYDEPREGIKYTTKSDWDKGELNDYASSSVIEGSLVTDIGHTTGISSTPGSTSAFGEKDHTYGRRFTVNKQIIVSRFRVVMRQKDTPYTVLLWDEDGEVLKSVSKVPTDDDVNKWIDLDFINDPVRLIPGEEYTIGISTTKDNGISQYDKPVILRDVIDRVGMFSIDKGATFPDEEDDVEDIAVDFYYDIDERTFSYGAGVIIPKAPDKDVEDDLSTGVLSGAAQVFDGHVYLKTTGTWREMNIVNWSDIA